MLPEGTRLGRQLGFIMEIDRLKGILRQTLIADASRRENSAEHSWHLALMALLLREYAPAGVDVERVVRLTLVHDLVEIDAGDTFAYDAAGQVDKAARERRAADRLFGLLPAEQGAELRALWDEFEEVATPEARFANALDRLQPLLENLHTDGGTWRIHGVELAKVRERMQPILDATPELWPFVEGALASALERGWLR